MPVEPGAGQQSGQGRGNYREFLNVVSRVIAENPDAIRAVEEHLRRHDRSALTGGNFAAATTQHQEIVNSFLQTDAGRGATQTLGDAYQRLSGSLGGARGPGGGGGQQEIIPIIIGGLIIVDIVIWGCVFTDCV